MTQSIQVSSSSYDDLKIKFVQTLTDIGKEQYSNLFEDFISIFTRVRSKIKRQSKFRTINLSFPPILYMFLKVNTVVTNRTLFVQSMNMDYAQLVKDMKHYIPLYPEFTNRDKSKMVFAIIKDIVDNFTLHYYFMDNAITLYNHFYPVLQFTSEELTAGVILILALIVSGITSPSMTEICKQIDVSGGSVSNKIKNGIIPKLHIPEYQSLIHSANLVKERLMSLMIFRSAPIPTNTQSPKKYYQDLSNVKEQSHLLLDVIHRTIEDKRNRYKLLPKTEFLIFTNMKSIRKNINYFIALLQRKNLKRDYNRIVGISIAFACPRSSLVDISRLVKIPIGGPLTRLFQRISIRGSFNQFRNRSPYLNPLYALEIFRILNYQIQSTALDDKYNSITSKANIIAKNIGKLGNIANEISFRVKEPIIVATCIMLADPQLTRYDLIVLMEKTLNIHINTTILNRCVQMFKVVKIYGKNEEDA